MRHASRVALNPVTFHHSVILASLVLLLVLLLLRPGCWWVQLLGPSDVDRVMRLQLTCMPEQTVIHVHQDSGGYAHEGHRIHVPLIVPPSTNAALFLTCPG